MMPLKYDQKYLCPNCNNTSKKSKNLDSAYLKNKLLAHFKTIITNDLEIIDYELLKCDECSFEFAYPQIEGSGSFYDWVTSQQNYYVGDRWEYSKVLDLLSSESKDIKLLDVGCGDGQFFDAIVNSKRSQIDFCGLDSTIGSIEICKNKNYKVFCMDIQKFKSLYKDSLFEAVTAYHVLEHISNPSNFVKELSTLLSPNGSIYISTPYSPMDFELDWFDVLNHPPHHMGRWNEKSYRMLATNLNMDIEIFMPEANTVFQSTINSLIFNRLGIKSLKKFEKIMMIGKYPFRFIKYYLLQRNRDKVNGLRAANTILVVLRNRN